MTDPMIAASHQDARLALLVLGMHRSGTSALTGLLGHLDITLPIDGIGAHPDNPTGYWEPQAVVTVDDRILRTARTSWFDPRRLDLDSIPAAVASAHRDALRTAIRESFGDAARIAIKDPRLCRLFPLVADALRADDRAVRVVLMLRPAGEIARSLRRRDRSTPAYAHALWLRHMIDAERATRTVPRTVITYDGLLDDWHGTLARIAVLTDRPGWSPDPAASAGTAALLDPGLRHHAGAAASGLEPDMERTTAAIEAALFALVAADDDAARARVDDAVRPWDADRTRLDDIVHDELRHRRFEELRLRAAFPEGDAIPVEPAPPAPPPEPPPPPPPPPPAPPAIPPSLEDQVTLVRDSHLFDAAWYLARYPDAATAGIDPIVHYLTVGAAQGHDPNPLFRTGYYAWQRVRRGSAEGA